MVAHNRLYVILTPGVLDKKLYVHTQHSNTHTQIIFLKRISLNIYVLENYIKVERPCAPFTWFPHGYLSWTFTVNIRIRGCHWCSVCSTRSIGFPSSVILLLLMQLLISSGILCRADASRLRLCLHLTCRHLVSLFPFPCRPTSYLNIFNNWFWFIVNALDVSTFRVFFSFF